MLLSFPTAYLKGGDYMAKKITQDDRTVKTWIAV